MANEKHLKTVPDALAGLRLDKVLAELFPDYSRSRLQAWLSDGAILVDGGSRRAKDRVDGGEEIEFNVVPDVAVHSQPEAMALDIVFEDDAMLVINKPAGLVVHPGAGNVTGIASASHRRVRSADRPRPSA